jgi:acetyl/propionyl-CoA carboxylase alpha subunit
LVFVGPPAEAIRRMGVKTEARAIMAAAGVPTVPGFQGDSARDVDFRREAKRIGYPVMVKAAGGGGGKGIRVVHKPDELAEALGASRREAEHAFGDAAVYLEKYIAHARHIEVQVLADSLGNTVHLFERECSVQRRHQKIVEETPSPLLTPEVRARMGQAAVSAARAVGYVNAGTVEFIADADANFYFMEMNTRLQVEHPITEMVTGLDLAQLQIRIAAGESLPFRQEDLSQRGHAIECRIYAEDPASGFLPAVGPVLRSIEPVGPGIRVDAGVASGDEVTLHYDPLIAKLIVLGADRAAAIRKMDAALGQYAILGLTTNLRFLRDVIRHPAFAAGEVDTEWVESALLPWHPPEADLPDEALIAAAIADMGAGSAAGDGGGNNDGDAYSPWDRADGFRMGN